jgi:hypothetical protein
MMRDIKFYIFNWLFNTIKYMIYINAYVCKLHVCKSINYYIEEKKIKKIKYYLQYYHFNLLENNNLLK